MLSTGGMLSMREKIPATVKLSILNSGQFRPQGFEA